MFALSLLTEDGLRGGLLQLMGHMSAKGCLFLSAGVFIIVLGAHEVKELKGIGNKDQLDIDIDINMVSLSQIIHVDFYTEKYYGYLPFCHPQVQNHLASDTLV